MTVNVLKQFGGLHRFEAWDRPILTESGGLQHVMALHQHAIAHGYRFFSYGDAMLLARER